MIKEIQKYVNGVNLYIPKVPEEIVIAAITNLSYTRETKKYIICFCKGKRFQNWLQNIIFQIKVYTGF